MGGDRAASAKEPARGTTGRRPAGNLRDRTCAEGGLPLVRLPGRLRAVDDDLQPVQPLVAPWLLAQAARRAGGGPRGDEEYRDRQHLHQGATRGVRRKRGRQIQAIGRSRGGWTTKVHALTDVIGRPYALMLTAGNVSDVKAASALLERAGRMRYLLADKGYDADRLRRSLRDAGAVPVIPGRRNRKRAIRYDKDRYRGRHLIENAFCRLKDFRRVATRYDKLAANFLSGVAIATAIAFWL
jgi:transposase